MGFVAKLVLQTWKEQLWAFCGSRWPLRLPDSGFQEVPGLPSWLRNHLWRLLLERVKGLCMRLAPAQSALLCEVVCAAWHWTLTGKMRIIATRFEGGKHGLPPSLIRGENLFPVTWCSVCAHIHTSALKDSLSKTNPCNRLYILWYFPLQ